jgi:hypothetical protein
MTEPGTQEIAAKPRRRWRAAVWHGLRAVILAAFMPLVFLGVAAFLVFDREITAPSWITTRMEAEAAGFLEGGGLSFGEMTLKIGADIHPRIALTNVVLRDADETVIARVPRADVQISPRGILFRREILIQTVNLTGAEIALRRASDGRVAVSFDAGGAVVQEADSFADLLSQIDAALERPEFEALESVAADGLILNFDDARARRGWTIDGGQVTLDLKGGQTRLRADLTLLSGRAYVTTIGIIYESPHGSRAATIALAFDDAVAADLASQTPALSWLAVVDAPMAAQMRLEIDEAGALGPFSSSLAIKAGDLRAGPDAPPVPFDEAKAYLTFDPEKNVIDFSHISAKSSLGTFAAEGRTTLHDLVGGWPASMTGQFSFSDLAFSPQALFPGPRSVDHASVDFRLGLAPFTVDVGEVRIGVAGTDVVASGRFAAGVEGWEGALDARIDGIDPAAALLFWPAAVKPEARQWVETNIASGRATDIIVAARLRPGDAFEWGGSFRFEDATLSINRFAPPLEGASGFGSFANNAMSLVLEEGTTTPAQGGTIDLSGSSLSVPDVRIPAPPARIEMRARGSVTAGLALIDTGPRHVITSAKFPYDLVDGQGDVTATVNLRLKEENTPAEISYVVTGRLWDLRSDKLVPGRIATADEIGLTSSNSGMTLVGVARVGSVPMTGTFKQTFNPDRPGTGRLDVSLPLDRAFLDEFRIALPDETVGGAAAGRLVVDLERDQPARFTLSSDLVGARMSLQALGWDKPAASAGVLEVTGSFGQPATIERLFFDAAGLEAEGTLRLNADGGFEAARFPDLHLSDWFQGSVSLVGRGKGRPAELVVDGGTLDLRKADFGEIVQGADSDGGPVTLRLDRLQVSEGVALTQFQGSFQSAGGLSGRFDARLNNDTAVQGSVAPYEGRMAFRLRSDDAGGALRSIGLLENATGGAMQLTLAPTGAEGNYAGLLQATSLRVQDAPSLAALLDAISVIGLLQQLDGQGISFDTVEARFTLSPDKITIAESSAVGLSLGISMDGVYTLATKAMDFQGVVSPVYLFNSIGAIFTREGEGLIGFNYRMTGTPGATEVSINPLSIFTPGMFREIFRQAPPAASE